MTRHPSIAPPLPPTRRGLPRGRRRGLLPGVGLRSSSIFRDGARIGVIVRRSGDFEIVVYEAADPDRARPAFRLADEEADALAQILGAPRIAPQPADLTREVPGLNASKIPIRPESPFTRAEPSESWRRPQLAFRKVGLGSTQ